MFLSRVNRLLGTVVFMSVLYCIPYMSLNYPFLALWELPLCWLLLEPVKYIWKQDGLATRVWLE